MYDNKTQFKFIKNLEKAGLKLGDTLQKLNTILFGVIEAKPYTFEWDKIISQYKKAHIAYNHDSLDKFCQDYVIGYSLLNDFSTEPAKKEAMYLHLKAEILAMKAKGELD